MKFINAQFGAFRPQLDRSWFRSTPEEEYLASLSSPQLWYGFLGRPKVLVEMVHKLLLLRTSTRKSRMVWDQEISVARTEAPGLLSRRDLSIVEVEIHSQNVEHPGANGERSSGGIWKFRASSFKCYVDHSHTIYSSGNIEVRNLVHLFESRCIYSKSSLLDGRK